MQFDNNGKRIIRSGYIVESSQPEKSPVIWVKTKKDREMELRILGESYTYDGGNTGTSCHHSGAKAREESWEERISRTSPSLYREMVNYKIL